MRQMPLGPSSATRALTVLLASRTDRAVTTGSTAPSAATCSTETPLQMQSLWRGLSTPAWLIRRRKRTKSRDENRAALPDGCQRPHRRQAVSRGLSQMAALQVMSGSCSLNCSQLRQQNAYCQVAHQVVFIGLPRMLCRLCKLQRSRAMAIQSMQPPETCQSLQAQRKSAMMGQPSPGQAACRLRHSRNRQQCSRLPAHRAAWAAAALDRQSPACLGRRPSRHGCQASVVRWAWP